MNAIYHLSEEGKRKRRWQTSLFMVFSFLIGGVAIGVAGRDRFFPEKGEAAIAVPTFFVLMIGLIIFVIRRRVPAMVESHAILLDDSGLALMQDGRAVVSITHDRVACVEVDADGALFVIGPRGRTALQITGDYAGLDQLREELELLHDMQPRRRRSFPLLYQQILAVLLLVPFSALFLFDSPAVVIPSAAILLGTITWCSVAWWRAYGFKGAGGKLVGTTALFAIIIILRTLVVLGVLRW